VSGGRGPSSCDPVEHRLAGATPYCDRRRRHAPAWKLSPPESLRRIRHLLRPLQEPSRSQTITRLASRARELVVTGYRRTASRLQAMGTSGTPEYRARRRAGEQQRRQQTAGKRPHPDQAGPAADGPERRIAATTCGWCGGPITPRRRGPIPKWCSAACRHRAWEQSRAANSGRTAVQVVERRVEIRVPLEPTRRDWPRLLGELAGQLVDGRVYDRDLPALCRALDPVLRSYRRRARWSGAPDLP
jgi:hypothetical protein